MIEDKLSLKVLKITFYLTFLEVPLTILSILLKNDFIAIVTLIVTIVVFGAAVFSSMAICTYDLEYFMLSRSKLKDILKINSNRKLLLFIIISMLLSIMLFSYLSIAFLDITTEVVSNVVILTIIGMVYSALLIWCSEDV